MESNKNGFTNFLSRISAIDLFNLAKVRTAGEAVGFYFGYLVLFWTSALILGLGLGALWNLAMVFCLALSGLILHRKKRIKELGFLLVALAAALLSRLLAPAVLGLIPVAYLTTLSVRDDKPSDPSEDNQI